jgi:hypothetical protein
MNNEYFTWRCMDISDNFEFFLEWEIFQTTSLEKIKINVVYLIFFAENRTFYEITWKIYGTAGKDTGDDIMRPMRFAWWILKDTDKHSEYAILIAFSLQHWLLEWSSMLHDVFIACLVYRLKKVSS